MSDDNHKHPSAGKATQAGIGGVPHPTRGGGVRTMIGVPVGAEPRAGLGGQRPNAPRDAARAQPDPADESDKIYMDPPSELLGRAQTEPLPELPPTVRPLAGYAPTQLDHVPRPPQPGTPRTPPPPAAPNNRHFGSFGGGLPNLQEPPERSDPHFGLREPGSYGGTPSRSAHEGSSPRHGGSEGPAGRVSNAQAPEAWRQDMRRVIDRSPSGRPASPSPATDQPAKTAAASLRLKLDLDSRDGRDGLDGAPYGRVPKSSLPTVLLSLVVLGALAGGAAYYASLNGGFAAVVARLSGHGAPAAPVDQQPAQAPQATPAPAAPVAQAPAPQAPQQPQEPSQPAAPVAAAPPPGTPEAQAAAEPPSRQPSAAAAERHEERDKPKPVTAPKPAPAAPRPTVHHEPVVRVKPIGAPPTSATPDIPLGPPDPSGAPVAPTLPIDPPMPDEH
jgi:hypothetical protein